MSCWWLRLSSLGRFATTSVGITTAIASSYATSAITPANDADNDKNNTPMSDRVKGHYENRIRQYSTHEKIFSTFASAKTTDGKMALMTFDNFRDAILPYDYRAIENRRTLHNPPLFLKKIVLSIDNPYNISITDSIDCSKSGVISLSEYIFMISLLGIKPGDFDLAFKMFDFDENGYMSSSEFMSLMKNFSIASTSAYNPDYIKKSPLWKQIFSTDKTFFQTTDNPALRNFQKLKSGLTMNVSTNNEKSGLSGNNSSSSSSSSKNTEESELNLHEFRSFLLNLRVSILLMEFDSYLSPNNEYNLNIPEELNKQYITAKDFAWSLVSYASHKDIAYYKAKIQRIPVKKLNLENVSWKEFRDFNMCLGYIEDIIHCLKLYKSCKKEVSQRDFINACKIVCNMELSSNIVNIIFWIFDKDGDGTLDYKELIGLFQNRFQFGQKNDRVFGFTKFVGCFTKCFKSSAHDGFSSLTS